MAVGGRYAPFRCGRLTQGGRLLLWEDRYCSPERTRLTASMDLEKALQHISNAIYAAIAWLILDLGLLFQEHGEQTLGFLMSQPQMAAGVVVTLACIVGLVYKSRLAALVLFLIFLVPQVLRLIQGDFPPGMIMLFLLFLMYFLFAGMLGTLSYHELKAAEQSADPED